MKLLLDENLSYRLVKMLEPAFPGTLHVSDVQGLKEDLNIWKYAQQEGFIIVTFDSDFIQLAALRGGPPKIIFLSLRNPRSSMVASLLIMRRPQIERFVERIEDDDPMVLELSDL